MTFVEGVMHQTICLTNVYEPSMIICTGYSPKTTTQPNNSTRRTLHSTAHNLTTSNSAKITPDKIMPSATKIPETKAAKMTFSTAERTMTPSPNRTTGSPDSFHSTTLTAPKSTCISRSITKQLDKGSRTLRLEVEPGRFLTLPAGDFVYEMKDMCSINITIKGSLTITKQKHWAW